MARYRSRNGLSSDALRLMHGVRAMHQFPDDADAIAAAFGITDKVAAMRQAREKAPISYVYLVDTTTPDGRYYKIGKSVAPHVRLQALRTGRAANMPPPGEGTRSDHSHCVWAA